MKKKILVPIVAVVLVFCCAIGGTLAWLTDKTAPVVNTFTVGDVEIELTETTGREYKMIPGYTLKKDPAVTVTADSEDCWLFVKVEESNNLDTFMTYAMAAGWTALEGEVGVFYHEVKTGASDQTFAVLKDDQVSVKDDVTKKMMNDLTENTYPTLSFAAYAVQQHKSNASGVVSDFTPAEAWAAIAASPVA